MKNFTDENLILYLYKDGTAKMQTAIEEAAATDIELNNRLKVLKRTIRQLNNLKPASPSKRSIKAILNYANEATKRNR